ncbi:hypothetical protein [Nonomuraea sp. LPB2021202275-12-8]|uniref:hypothetical protein n=1 Tax=Nonomuraea sp. LPB2021202275-12-8 TaxID=3120159 RepID=UPI00300D323A
MILTGRHGERGSLSRSGLTNAYSGHNQLRKYGPPPGSATVASVLNIGARIRDAQFSACEQKAPFDNGTGAGD